MKTFLDVLNTYRKSTRTKEVLNHGFMSEYLGPTEFGQAIYILNSQNSLSLQQALKKQEQIRILQLVRHSKLDIMNRERKIF